MVEDVMNKDLVVGQNMNGGIMSHGRSFDLQASELPPAPSLLKLSEESWFKIHSFFRKFCLEEDSPGHMLFACYAAFPMILSAKLANILWLNFNGFKMNGVQMHIEPVAVSDILLSPMMRAVGHGQMEFIPEIRLYLLYLLSSKTLFKHLGLDLFEEDRLSVLSKFIFQYFSNGPAMDYNGSRFQQVNQWAAYSYENPEQLAVFIGKEFAKTFSDDGTRDENAQLALNVLMNRFNLQLKLNITQFSKQTRPIFDNLYSFSTATRNVAFGEDIDKISDSYYSLSNRFLGDGSQGLRLPVAADASVLDRVARKKRNIRRVIPIVDSFALRGEVETMFSVLSGLKHLKIESPEFMADQGPMAFVLTKALKEAFNNANDEDLVLVILSGQLQIRSGDYSALDPEKFKANLDDLRGGSKAQLVLLSSQIMTEDNFLVGPDDVQVSCLADEEYYSHELNSDLFFKQFCFLLTATRGQISYSDMALAMGELMNFQANSSNYRIVFKLPAGQEHHQFLSGKPLKSNAYEPMFLFNNLKSRWQIVSEPFMMNAPFDRFSVHDYFSGRLIQQGRSQMVVKDELYLAAEDIKLNKDGIYRIKSDNNNFFYVLEVGNSQVETHISELVDALGLDALSGRRFRRVESIEKALDFAGVLSITQEFSQQGEAASFGLTYFIKAVSGGYQLFFHGITSTEKELKDWLIKIRSFDYFLSLINDNHIGNTRMYDSFQLSAELENHLEGTTEANNQISIGKDFYRIENGRLIIKPLRIRVAYNRKDLVYFNLYIAWSDLTIEPIRLNQQIGQDMPEEVIVLELENYFDEIFVKGQSFSVKAIVYESPLNQNFSQKGIYQLR
jgi:hypothetical protein